MDFNYIKFTEEWAQLYKPMHHMPGEDSINKRFFICDSYMTMTNFMEHMDAENTPCVIVESQQEGNISYGKDYPRYSLYFMVRAGHTHEGYSAYDAKSEAKQVMLDFINFLRVFKYSDDYREVLTALPLQEGSYLDGLRCAVTEFGSRCMENINIEEFVYESLNELYDTWYGVQVTLDDTKTFNLCLDLAHYV